MFWDYLKVSEGTPAFDPGASDLPELVLRCRSDERLERLKPMTGGIVEILLAKHASGTIPHSRKRFLGVGEFLGELAGSFPKRRPGSRARTWQNYCRKCTFA